MVTIKADKAEIRVTSEDGSVINQATVAQAKPSKECQKCLILVSS